jgi:hypothetical protein
MSALSWTDANQRYLMAALGLVREALERHGTDDAGSDSPAKLKLDEAAAAMPSPSALDILTTRFGLSPFERDVVLLCAGIDLDSSFAAVVARAQGDPSRTAPTFSLALAALPSAHWSALTPSAPLRRWRMIEIGSGSVLTLGALRIDERILHYLAGVQSPDDRLAGLVEPLDDGGALMPSHQELAERIAASWTRASGNRLPVVQLHGDDVADQRAIAAAACASLGLRAAVMAAHSIPTTPAELDGFIRLWGREALLRNVALLIECHELDAGDSARSAALNQLLEKSDWPLIVCGGERRRMGQRAALTFDVRRPTTHEQRELWQHVLGDTAGALNGQVDVLTSQFDLTLQKLHAAHDDAASHPEQDLGRALWDACRRQARPQLDNLAQRIDPAATWEDLVLPEMQLRPLREIAVHVRQRTKVYDTWGFASKGARGLGISALFAGVSGTGKTMAAEVLANDLRLDLYRIDLSAVVSKYIGETEKNLRRVFDAAEEGGAILLFDEADALFGKRSEVKDSHDRYANIEVSYLLQRMEAYRGLAILTTNLKNALDTAFMRRIRFIVHFPFPDAMQRAEIWRRIFPRQTPTESLDTAKLARLNMAGGNIRSIALNAAFLAAEAREPVRMTHVLRAAQGEYTKLERSLSDAEVRGWES